MRVKSRECPVFTEVWSPIGMKVVKEVERKVGILQRAFHGRTIQRVLVVHGTPSRELADSGYFVSIIEAGELLM